MARLCDVDNELDFTENPVRFTLSNKAGLGLPLCVGEGLTLGTGVALGTGTADSVIVNSFGKSNVFSKGTLLSQTTAPETDLQTTPR